MNLDPFARGGSLLHRLDPRAKLVAATAFAGVVAVASDPFTLGASLVLAAALAGMARLGLAALARRLAVVNGFVGLLWLLLPFTVPGPALFGVGPLTASRAGVDLAAALTVRTNAIVLATIALIGTTSVFRLVHALQHLHVPVKLVHLAFFTYRYISVIEREYQRLRSAMRIRCFRPRTNLHTYVSVAYLAGMLLVRSYERSERVYQAMLCRGFRGSFPVYHHFALAPRDALFLLAMGAAVACLLGVPHWAG